MTTAIFERHGGRFQPTVAARGPWDPNALHGGPVAMLVARAIEACPADVEMDVVRLTLELLKPVPMSPLEVAAEVERPGRRVRVLGAAVMADGVEVARARALQVRRADLGVASADDPPPPGPDGIEPWAWFGGSETFGGLGVELRVVSGTVDSPGPATLWVRLALPVVAGEEPSPLQRVAAAADFGNGVSFVLDWQSHVFINPDLTIHLARPSSGEWVCMASRSVIGDGYGLAHSELYDRRGWIGRAIQSLYVAER